MCLCGLSGGGNCEPIRHRSVGTNIFGLTVHTWAMTLGLSNRPRPRTVPNSISLREERPATDEAQINGWLKRAEHSGALSKVEAKDGEIQNGQRTRASLVSRRRGPQKRPEKRDINLA